MKELGLNAEQQQGLADLYIQLQGQFPTLDRAHVKEARADLVKRWGGEAQYAENIQVISEFLDDRDRVSARFANWIEQARMPDGRRAINDPEVASILAYLGRASAEDGVNDAIELSELRNLLETDAGAFQYGKWRGIDQSPSDRMLELERRRAGPAENAEIADAANSSASLAAEQRHLERLMETDITTYMTVRKYGPARDQTASDRLLEIMRMRAGR
jgi:hypothetical protein